MLNFNMTVAGAIAPLAKVRDNLVAVIKAQRAREASAQRKMNFYADEASMASEEANKADKLLVKLEDFLDTSK